MARLKIKKDTIVLAVPNGSLQDATLRILSKIGIEIVPGRKSMYEINLEGMHLIVRLMRPQSIPLTVLKGKAHLGITGWDWVVENRADKKLKVITEMQYSKKTNSSVNIVVVCKTGSSVDKNRIVDTKSRTVYAEYPKIAKTVFKKAKIIFSHGSTEAEISAGTYDYGVLLTETGESIDANGLKIAKKIIESSTVLVSREEKEEYKTIGELLTGVLEGRKNETLEMNIPDSKVSDIVKILPSLGGPTISKLAKIGNNAEERSAIRVVVNKQLTPKLIIKLRKMGATGIFTQDINVLLE